MASEGERNRDEFDADPWEMPQTESRPVRRAGMSTGVKVVLASVFGCGGCLALVLVAVFALGASFFSALEDAGPVGSDFVEAVSEGRTDDALALLDPEQGDRSRIERQLIETVDYVTTFGRFQRKSGRGMHRSVTDEGSFFRVQYRSIHTGGDVDWTIQLVERDDAWFVRGWQVDGLNRGGSVREDDDAVDDDARDESGADESGDNAR